MEGISAILDAIVQQLQQVMSTIWRWGHDQKKEKLTVRASMAWFTLVLLTSRTIAWAAILGLPTHRFIINNYPQAHTWQNTYALPCFLLMVSQTSILTARLGSKRDGLHALSTKRAFDSCWAPRLVKFFSWAVCYLLNRVKSMAFSNGVIKWDKKRGYECYEGLYIYMNGEKK